MRPDAGNERQGRRGSDVRIPRRTDKRETDGERSAERLPREIAPPRRGFDQPPRLPESNRASHPEWDHQRNYDGSSFSHFSHEPSRSFEMPRILEQPRIHDHASRYPEYYRPSEPTRFREPRSERGPEREYARSVERAADVSDRFWHTRHDKFRSPEPSESLSSSRFSRFSQRPPVIPKAGSMGASYLPPRRQQTRDLVMGYPAPQPPAPPQAPLEDLRVLQMGPRSASQPRLSQRASIKLAVSKRHSSTALLPGAESSTSSSNEQMKADAGYSHLLGPLTEHLKPGVTQPPPSDEDSLFHSSSLLDAPRQPPREELPSVPSPPVKDTTRLSGTNESEARTSSPSLAPIAAPTPPSSPSRPRRLNERQRHMVTDTDSSSSNAVRTPDAPMSVTSRQITSDMTDEDKSASNPALRTELSSEEQDVRDRIMKPFLSMQARCNEWIPLLVKPPTESGLKELCAMLEVDYPSPRRLFEDTYELDEARLAANVTELIKALELRVKAHSTEGDAYEVGAAKMCRALLEATDVAAEFYRSHDMVGDPVAVRFPALTTQVPSSLFTDWPRSNEGPSSPDSKEAVFDCLREMGELVSEAPWEVALDDDLVNTIGTFAVFDARPDDVIFNLIKNAISKKLLSVDVASLGQFRAQCRKDQRKWLKDCNDNETSDVLRFGVLPMRASLRPNSLSLAPSGGWPWLMPGGQYVTKRNTIDKLLLEAQWFSLGAKAYMRPLAKQSAAQRPVLSFYNDLHVDRNKPVTPALFANGNHLEDRPAVRADVLRIKPHEDLLASNQKIYAGTTQAARSQRLLPSGTYNYTGPPPNWASSALLDPPYTDSRVVPLDIAGSLRAKIDPFIDEAFESCSLWTMETLLTFAKLTFENGYHTKTTSAACHQSVKACTILYGLLKFWMRPEQVDDFTAIEMSSSEVKNEELLSEGVSPRKKARPREEPGSGGRPKRFGARSKNPQTEAMLSRFKSEFLNPLFHWVKDMNDQIGIVGVGMDNDLVTLQQIRLFKIKRVRDSQWPRPWLGVDALEPDAQAIQYYPQGTSLILPRDVEAVIVQDKGELHIAGRRATEMPTTALQVAERVTTHRDPAAFKPPEETIEENYRGLLGAVALKNEAVQRELSKMITAGLTTKGLSDAVMSIFVRHNAQAVEAYTPMPGPAVPESPKLSPQFRATRSSPIEPPLPQEPVPLRQGASVSRESWTNNPEDEAEENILQDLLYGPIR